MKPLRPPPTSRRSDPSAGDIFFGVKRNDSWDADDLGWASDILSESESVSRRGEGSVTVKRSKIQEDESDWFTEASDFEGSSVRRNRSVEKKVRRKKSATQDHEADESDAEIAFQHERARRRAARKKREAEKAKKEVAERRKTKPADTLESPPKATKGSVQEEDYSSPQKTLTQPQQAPQSAPTASKTSVGSRARASKSEHKRTFRDQKEKELDRSRRAERMVDDGKSRRSTRTTDVDSKSRRAQRSIDEDDDKSRRVQRTVDEVDSKSRRGRRTSDETEKPTRKNSDSKKSRGTRPSLQRSTSSRMNRNSIRRSDASKEAELEAEFGNMVQERQVTQRTSSNDFERSFGSNPNNDFDRSFANIDLEDAFQNSVTTEDDAMALGQDSFADFSAFQSAMAVPSSPARRRSSERGVSNAAASWMASPRRASMASPIKKAKEWQPSFGVSSIAEQTPKVSGSLDDFVVNSTVKIKGAKSVGAKSVGAKSVGARSAKSLSLKSTGGQNRKSKSSTSSPTGETKSRKSSEKKKSKLRTIEQNESFEQGWADPAWDIDNLVLEKPCKAESNGSVETSPTCTESTNSFGSFGSSAGSRVKSSSRRVGSS